MSTQKTTKKVAAPETPRYEVVVGQDETKIVDNETNAAVLHYDHIRADFVSWQAYWEAQQDAVATARAKVKNLNAGKGKVRWVTIYLSAQIPVEMTDQVEIIGHLRDFGNVSGYREEKPTRSCK